MNEIDKARRELWRAFHAAYLAACYKRLIDNEALDMLYQFINEAQTLVARAQRSDDSETTYDLCAVLDAMMRQFGRD